MPEIWVSYVAMTLDSVVPLVIVIALVAYLVAALIRPDKF